MKLGLASLFALLALVVCSACGLSHGAVQSSVLREPVGYPVQTPGGAEVTLAAATRAAQENIDHFTDGDFGAVWERMEQDVRDGISKADFVSFYETCKKPGAPVDVNSLRLEPDGKAVVSMMSHGVQRIRYLVYEDGAWNMKATEDFAAHLGEPLQQLISEEISEGHCG
jgi:hypothetical protein